MALTECPPRVTDPCRRRVTLQERIADDPIVWVSGEHDASTVPELAENLAQAIASGDGDVVVDLSAVRFMDASTIGVMVRADEYLRPRARALTIKAASHSARRVAALSELVGCGFGR
jgi:anti-anti-sigma factor